MSGSVFGQSSLGDANSEFNSNSFLVKQVLSRVATATLAKVVAVTNSGGVSPVGFVDVLPMVNQVDGSGNSQPHVTAFNLPYFRLQGGSDAVILDPKVGDIGIVIFASRDISSVKASKAAANPGSNRRHSMSDGLYIGGVLNGPVTQYVEFNTSGITIVSPNVVTVQAATINLNASTQANITAPNIALNGNTLINGHLSQGTGTNGGSATILGPVNVTGDVIAGGKSLDTHVHGGVQTGAGTTSAPV